MIGGNDVRNAALEGPATARSRRALTTELAAISTLSGEGAKHFLVVNVPNVGIIPEFAQDNPTLSAPATAVQPTLRQGPRRRTGRSSDLGAGTTLTDFDLYDFNANILANAASLGFTNTTDRCFTNTPGSAATTSGCGPDGANIDSFLYWDDIHPTARVQAMWAQGFLAAVPEPSTWAMLLIGFVGLGFAGYRRGVQARAPAA